MTSDSSSSSTIRLPNAMVGRELHLSLSPLLGVDQTGVPQLDLLSELPAGLELEDGALTGIPLHSGDYLIKLSVHPLGQEHVVSLIINPDPQSLWKNIPSDPNGVFWKSDATTETLSDGPLSVIGASLRGRSHAHIGNFRDDDMAIAWFPGSQWYSLTTADGAGSSKFSRQGSKIACERVKSYFTECFGEGAGEALSKLVSTWSETPEDLYAADQLKRTLYTHFGTAMIEARNGVEEQAATLEATSRDFHTTLITVLLHPLPDGRWFIASFSVGDGAAAIVSPSEGAPCLLTRPDTGEYAGQTVFITMNEALASYESIMQRINMAIIPSFEAVLLVTDGISDPCFDSDTQLAEPAVWNSLWDQIRTVTANATSREDAAAAILRWLAFHSPGHHDDRTLVLATPHVWSPKL